MGQRSAITFASLGLHVAELQSMIAGEVALLHSTCGGTRRLVCWLEIGGHASGARPIRGRDSLGVPSADSRDRDDYALLLDLRTRQQAER